MLIRGLDDRRGGVFGRGSGWLVPGLNWECIRIMPMVPTSFHFMCIVSLKSDIRRIRISMKPLRADISSFEAIEG